MTSGIAAFTVETEVHGQRLVLTCAGELDCATAHVLRQALGVQDHDVVLDFADVRFLDAAGIRVLVDAAERIRTAGHALELRRPQPIVQRVLDVVDAGTFVPGVHSRRAADRPDSSTRPWE